MKFAVNYVFEDVMELLRPSDTLIKYPGGKWDLETLRKLINQNHPIVLHGIIPSSGSILDPALCDKIEEFAKFVKCTDQKWLSFHLDHKDKYMSADLHETITQNINKIREYCGKDIMILLENMPPVDGIKDWCADPNIISEYCQRYNLGLLLDVPHLVISAKFRGESVEEYLSKLPLEKVKEIHISGWSTLPDGNLYDSHIECGEESYELLKQILVKTLNCEMVSLEYAPSRDYDGYQCAKEYREERTTEDFYYEQQKQLKIIKIIVSKTKEYSK